jgi:mycobactin lysine-N-oxygenase
MRKNGAETDLLVLGAGAKGTAIAAKAHVLNSLGLGLAKVSIVEATGPASAWRDGNGVTSSREILGLTPSKDVGFPYQSARAFGAVGADVDAAMVGFSWQSYLVEAGRYATWIDAGSPSVQRRVFGDYLAWALARASDGVELIDGRLARVSLEEGRERWDVLVATASGPVSVSCAALALTGQGVQRVIPHELEVAARVLDCESGRMEIARATPEASADIAIVGGGESALSCMEFTRGLRPDAQLTVYTSSLPMSRVESFLENRVFSRPDDVGWCSLGEAERREFIMRSDRGVFGSERVAPFAYDERCRFVGARVTYLGSACAGRKVCVTGTSPGGPIEGRHDYVINCTGYDPLEQLRTLLTPGARAHVAACAGDLWGRSPAGEVAIGRSLELEGMRPRVHIPGLAAHSQGPGFSTLGALGLVADRVLEPLYRDRRGGARSLRHASAATRRAA